jgi:hypothetical protein
LRQLRKPFRQFIPRTAVENGIFCIFSSMHQYFLNSTILYSQRIRLPPLTRSLCSNVRTALPYAATSSIESPSRRVPCSTPHIWLRCPGHRTRAPPIAHYTLPDGPKVSRSEQKANLSLKRERRARRLQINRTWPANEGHGGADDDAIGATPHAPINTDGAALAPVVVSSLPSPSKSSPSSFSTLKIPIEFTAQQTCPPTQ